MIDASSRLQTSISFSVTAPANAKISLTTTSLLFHEMINEEFSSVLNVYIVGKTWLGATTVSARRDRGL